MDTYNRSILKDRTCDKPFLASESHMIPQSSSRINLRENGNRGYGVGLVHHPDVFIGNLEPDPRGTSTAPNFYEVKGQISSRATLLKRQMGHNSIKGSEEGPLTAQSISNIRKIVHHQVKDNTKVFSRQLEGQESNNNTPINKYAATNKLIDSLTHGEIQENLTLNTKVNDVNDKVGSSFSLRKYDPSSASNNTISTSKLGVHAYSQIRSPGVKKISLHGGTYANIQKTDTDFAKSVSSGQSNRNILAATMALAAKSRKVLSSTLNEQHLNQSTTNIISSNNLKPSNDVSKTYYNIINDHVPTDSIKSTLVSNALIPTKNTNNYNLSLASTTSNEHLTNMHTIVQGLKSNNMLDRKHISAKIAVDSMLLKNSDVSNGTGRGLILANDLGIIRKYSDKSIIKADASELKVNVYRSVQPSIMNQLSNIRIDNGAFKKSEENKILSSHPQVSGYVNNPAHNITEIKALPSAHTDGRALQMGKKNLRANTNEYATQSLDLGSFDG